MSEPTGIGAEPAPLPVVVAASLLAVGGLSGWYVSDRVVALTSPDVAADEGRPSRPDVFLVTLGGARADHLTTWRYERATAPWLAEVAKRSQIFVNASATSSSSLPSIASLLTGLLPSQHGLDRLPRPQGGAVATDALAESVTPLAERLRDAGYDTWAVVANPAFLAETGLGRGFQSGYTNLGAARAPRARLAVERIAAVVERSPNPTFVWVHLGDGEAPYWLGSPMVNVWQEGADEDADGGAPDREAAATYSRMAIPELLGRPELAAPGPDLDTLVTLYDGELRSMDDHLQLLFGDLGVDDEDVLVVASDHGQAFREHGQLGARDLHEESVHVPLLVSWPKVWTAPRRHRERVSLADLAPTIAAIAGVPIPEGEAPSARSLLPILDGEADGRGAPVVAELLRADGVRCRAIWDGDDKLVAGEPGRMELYDLAEDAAEATDLAAARPDRATELLRALETAVGGADAAAPVAVSAEVSPQLARQLRALADEVPAETPCP